MKKAFISLFLLTAGVFASSAENLVILTTNDTHSNIDFDNNDAVEYSRAKPS